MTFGKALRFVFVFAVFGLAYEIYLAKFLGVRTPGAGLSLLVVAGAALYLRSAYSLRRISRAPLAEWRDGMITAIEGTIETANPIDSPFGGIECAANRYVVYWQPPSRNRIECFYGGSMATCSVRGKTATLSLSGIPALRWFEAESRTGDDVLERAARYLTSARFVAVPPLRLRAASIGNAVVTNDAGVSSGDFEVTPPGSAFVREASGDPAKAKRKLSLPTWFFLEQIVRIGDHVTAVGVYRRGEQALDVGAFLTELGKESEGRGLYRGSLEKASRRMVARGVVLFACACLVAAYLNVRAFAPHLLGQL